MNINFEIIPKNPGIYIMKNKYGNVIYVGKAINLNSRVKQYFNGTDKREKIPRLISEVESIEYIVTDNELEALVLENNFIKEYQPRFNTLLKDSKQYPFICLTEKDGFKKFEISRNITSSIFFGPFKSTDIANNILKILQDLYKIPSCTTVTKNRCLFCQTNKCLAPCINKISKEEYDKAIKKCISVLNGNVKNLISLFQMQMEEFSKNMEYENAIIARENIKNLQFIQEKQNVYTNLKNTEDFIGIDKNVVVIFHVFDGKVSKKEHFLGVKTEDFGQFLKQYYLNCNKIPHKIALNLLPEDIDDIILLVNSLSKKKITVYKPQKGNSKHIIDLLMRNVEMLSNEEERKSSTRLNIKNEGIKQLEKILGFSINRIESYDISNISGSLNVASMIVFKNNEFSKNDFRKFKLLTNGANDYVCMQEVIKRRFTDEKIKEKPNVLFIDGGLGQIHAVKEILDELNLNINVCGMVKDDNHNTFGLIYNDKILDIKKNSYAFKLITQIQDRTHNFAINYHRKLRTNSMINEKLEDIDGIGKKRAALLLQRFGSLDDIKKQSIESLCNIPGITKEIAIQIKNLI